MNYLEKYTFKTEGKLADEFTKGVKVIGSHRAIAKLKKEAEAEILSTSR